MPRKLSVNLAEASSVDTGIEVYVRKRPQFKHEVARGEYDIVSVASQNQVRVLFFLARAHRPSAKQPHGFRFRATSVTILLQKVPRINHLLLYQQLLYIRLSKVAGMRSERVREGFRGFGPKTRYSPCTL